MKPVNNSSINLSIVIPYMLLLHVNNFFKSLEFSIWVLTFTCLIFARNFIRWSLIWRVIYNRESSAVIIRTNKVTG